MPPNDPITDPWSAAFERRANGLPREGGRPGAWRPFAAWALALGIVVQAWLFGGRTWSTLVVGAGAAALFEVAVRAWRGRSRWAPAARVVAVLAVAAGAASVLGATPTALLALAVVIADGALVSWTPVPGWPQRERPTATIAVGLLVVAQVNWIRIGSRPLVLGLLVVALVVLEAYARWPAGVSRIEDAISRGVRAVTTVIVEVVLAVVALIVLYLPGAIVRLVRAPFGPRRERQLRASSWQPIDTTLRDNQRDAIRGYTSTPGEVRARRTRSGLALVLAVALVAVVVDRAHREQLAPVVPEELKIESVATTAATPPDPKRRQIFATELAADYSTLPAYAGVSWAHDLQMEETGVVDGTHVGKYVNIRNGRRVTLEPKDCSCPHATLWLSGGSAAFGTGQRDAHTIASDLVRVARERDGIALEVQNHSHDGYTIQMEDEWEIEQSLRTEDPPDLLVFYDGWNDAMAELAQEFLRGPDPERKMSMILPTDLDAINGDTDAFLASDVGRQAGEAAAARYLAVQRRVDEAAAKVGTRTAYFFQADALASARQLADYEPITGIPTKDLLASPLTACLEAMTTALGDRVADLRHLFDDTERSTFLGLVHQNEWGAQRVAEAIYEELRPQILELAR